MANAKQCVLLTGVLVLLALYFFPKFRRAPTLESHPRHLHYPGICTITCVMAHCTLILEIC